MGIFEGEEEGGDKTELLYTWNLLLFRDQPKGTQNLVGIFYLSILPLQESVHEDSTGILSMGSTTVELFSSSVLLKVGSRKVLF